MSLSCFANEIASSVKGILKSDLDHWRKAGYGAVDKLVERLKDQVEGKDVEEISNLLREEGKNVTAAIFEQMINSLGKEELQAKAHACPECNRTLKSPRNMRRSIDTQHGRIALPVLCTTQEPSWKLVKLTQK